jgi:Ca2+-binding EF-hand superfamily protein
MYHAWLGLLIAGICSFAAPSAWAADEPAADGPQKTTGLFDSLDANHDGQLSQDEIPADKQTLFARLLTSADADGNGVLTRQEFAAGLESRRPKRAEDQKLPADFGGLPSPTAVDEMFRKLDRNQDGKVVGDEIPDEYRAKFDRLAAMADKDRDGALTQDELRQGFDHIRQQFEGKPGQYEPAQIFEYLDRNADGKLTADEIPSERKAMFDRAVQFGDRDGDGALTEEEFTKIVLAGRKLKEAQAKPSAADSKAADPPAKAGRGSRLADWFSRLDSNHDGKVSLAEFPEQGKKRFARLDTNHDGSLDREEIQQFAAARAAKMGNPEPANEKEEASP